MTTFDGVAANRRALGLIDHHAGLVVVGEDVLAFLRPSSGLLEIGGGFKVQLGVSLLLFSGNRRITSMVSTMLSFRSSSSSAGTHHSV